MDDWDDSAGSIGVSAPEGINRGRVFGGRGRGFAPADNRPGFNRGKSHERVCAYVRVQCLKGPQVLT